MDVEFPGAVDGLWHDGRGRKVIEDQRHKGGTGGPLLVPRDAGDVEEESGDKVRWPSTACMTQKLIDKIFTLEEGPEI